MPLCVREQRGPHFALSELELSHVLKQLHFPHPSYFLALQHAFTLPKPLGRFSTNVQTRTLSGDSWRERRHESYWHESTTVTVGNPCAAGNPYKSVHC